MNNLAQRIDSGPVVGENGTVVLVDDGGFVVRGATHELRARRAVSCLVQPEAGDFVLVTVPAHGVGYILAVLERPTESPARMVLEGDLDVHLGHGRFSVTAQRGVHFVTEERVDVAAAGVDIRAVDGSVFFERLSYVGTFVQAEVERVKLLAASMDAVLDRWVQRVKRSVRVVEETDHVRAGNIDHAARESLHLRGRNALLTADELVKLDAEQIHLG